METTIDKSNIVDRFSIDKDGKIYRVEVYHEGKFSGMVLVNFDPEHSPSQEVAVAPVQNILGQ